mmetsp:Transcript_23510/g.56071  ORF Transcript_23510/g.56071 Transcript_23510/m.56071 type:complete len:217 (-) Transcript_23510:1143-1793(-)
MQPVVIPRGHSSQTSYTRSSGASLPAGQLLHSSSSSPENLPTGQYTHSFPLRTLPGPQLSHSTSFSAVGSEAPPMQTLGSSHSKCMSRTCLLPFFRQSENRLTQSWRVHVGRSVHFVAPASAYSLAPHVLHTPWRLSQAVFSSQVLQRSDPFPLCFPAGQSLHSVSASAVPNHPTSWMYALSSPATAPCLTYRNLTSFHPGSKCNWTHFHSSWLVE